MMRTDTLFIASQLQAIAVVSGPRSSSCLLIPLEFFVGRRDDYAYGPAGQPRLASTSSSREMSIHSSRGVAE